MSFFCSFCSLFDHLLLLNSHTHILGKARLLRVSKKRFGEPISTFSVSFGDIMVYSSGTKKMGMSANLVLQFLGLPRVHLDDQAIATDRRKAIALLAYLAVNDLAQPHQKFSRESLSALFWPDYEQAKAYSYLRRTLWEIHQIIGAGWLIAEREFIAMNAEAKIDLDISRFRELLSKARKPKLAPSLRISLLSDAISLYRDHFLSGFSLRDAPPFDEWASAQSEKLKHELAGALSLLSETYCASNQAEAALPYARRRVALDPLNESSHRQLMEVYVQAGQRNAALNQYHVCERLLRKELNLDPQPETRALYKTIRKGAAVLPKHNLPLQLTSFVGREKELADIQELLQKTRLLTLIGPGGTGKTRLSIEVAGEMLDQFPDGVWLVELAPIFDPLLVSRTTAIAIGLRDEPQRPVIDMLCDYLREKRMLILLDNCEHLVDACAQMADRILHAAPHSSILASSREGLGIGGEVTYRVPSLGLPDLGHLPPLESLSQYEAVKLFLDRATAAVPSFTVTNATAPALAQICYQLDGIPLAIELAAVKVRVLGVDQIARRLDDRFRLLNGGSRTTFERHQTLRAAIDWSYNLLPAAEQVLFRRLSVFGGGWTLDAAEQVCADGPAETDDVLGLLEQLINKSLVMKEEVQDGTRYRMLETIRHYASEKLVETGESDGLRDRHMEYFLELVETAAPHLVRPEQLEWLARLDEDLENLRLVLEWSLSNALTLSSLRLCSALGTFWVVRCYWKEGSRWLESALAQPLQNASIEERIARARALNTDAELASYLYDLTRMEVSTKASLDLCDQEMYAHDLAIARFYAGQVSQRSGQNERARLLLEQSLAEFRERGDLYWEARTYSLLAQILVETGSESRLEGNVLSLELARKAGERLHLAQVLYDQAVWAWNGHQIERAETYLRECEILREQLRYRDGWSLYRQAVVAHFNKDYQQAKMMFTEVKDQGQFLGNKRLHTFALVNLGTLARDEGDFEAAQSYIEEALTVAQEIGSKHFVMFRLALLAEIQFLQGNLVAAKLNLQRCMSIAKELTDGRDAIGLTLLISSNFLLDLLPHVAVQLYGAACAHVEMVGGSQDRFFLRESDRFIAKAHKVLDEVSFESAFAKGQTLSLDEALNLVSEMLEELYRA